ncbi:hypothetical protein R5R35_008096 [Gryllus longicercus]|uniref:Receptor ligand binding region domain-containing protein n=1 Tax=Gryllus longicercus TaxID=2509291 RepID=A0AAN9YZN8_9ORTH|nr:Guanylate cyclase [Gryllus bimaculatus]
MFSIAASVARLVKFYGTPLITTGGMSMDFMTDKTTCANEYHMLVRVGTMSFFSMSEFLISVMDKYGWKKVMMVYEKNGYSRVAGEHTCHLFMQSLVGELKKKKFLYNAYDMDKNPDVPVKENLRREMQLTYSREIVENARQYLKRSVCPASVA